MTTTRTVHEMLSVQKIPDGTVVGAECANGHRSKTVAVDNLAEEGSEVRCEECGEPVTKTLMEA